MSLEQMYNGHQLQSSVPRLLVCRNCQQSTSERCRRCNQRCGDEMEMRQVSRSEAFEARKALFCSVCGAYGAFKGLLEGQELPRNGEHDHAATGGSTDTSAQE